MADGKRERIHLVKPGTHGVRVGPYRVRCGNKLGDSWTKIAAKRAGRRRRSPRWLVQQTRGRKGYS